MLDNIYRDIVNIMDRKEQAVLLTIIETEGSVPNKVGAKMLLMGKGKTSGTIGGGTQEAIALKKAEHIFQSRKPETVTLNLEPAGPGSTGSTCGGKLTIYMEPINMTEKIVIFGCGHVCMEVYKLAKMLNFEVTVIDDRPDFANKERFPMADRILCMDFVESVKEITFDSHTYVILVTKGHKWDHVVLRAILGKDEQPAYTGMIGSRTKVKTLFEQLISEGISQDKLKRVYSPIGLDIGGDSPAEISVSIFAEILKVKYGRTGISLKETGQ
ncbi:MAG: XdhC/CoxI family protein [Candidatus Eremiobacterota bacterium]